MTINRRRRLRQRADGPLYPGAAHLLGERTVALRRQRAHALAEGLAASK